MMFNDDITRRARARNLADDLRREEGAGRAALLRNMVMINGGCLTEPRPADTSDAQRYELNLMAITTSGDTLDACIAEWIAAARRCAPISTSDFCKDAHDDAA